MISSTLIIISAASDALIRAYSLTLKASYNKYKITVIPKVFMQSTYPSKRFNPLVTFPFSISTLRS